VCGKGKPADTLPAGVAFVSAGEEVFERFVVVAGAVMVADFLQAGMARERGRGGDGQLAGGPQGQDARDVLAAGPVPVLDVAGTVASVVAALIVNQHGEDYHGQARQLTPESDPESVARACVNFLRHRCSSYEQRLSASFAAAVKPGVSLDEREQLTDESYSAIKNRVLAEIARVYPWLADECRQQCR
jgi:hypothetical protein